MHSTAGPILLAILIGWWAGCLGNQQYAKGLTILVGTLVVTYLGGCIGLLIAWGLGIVDCINIANRINRGEAVAQWQFF